MIDLDLLFDNPPHTRRTNEGLHRCLACEAGATEPYCWLCGSTMERGDITSAGICYKVDNGMRPTEWEPGRRDELKTLDGLVLLPGEPEFRGVFNPEVRFLHERRT